MAGAYVPPHRRGTQPQQRPSGNGSAGGAVAERSTWRRPQPRSDPNIIFFGDSFVRLFGLVENPKMKVKAFKGASAKGLGRAGNENRDEITKQVQRLQPDRIILCFGNVDLHLSFYFTKYTKDGPTIDLQTVAQSYVDFAATLPAKHVHIVGVYPSAVQEDYIVASLRAYGAIGEDIEVSQDDISIVNRQRRVQEFNQHIEQECEKHGIVFDSSFSEMVDSQTDSIKPTFQDVSPYNIHVVWETTILLWLERWPWLRELTPTGFERKIQATLEEYLRTKPSETTHIAANIGVGEAFDVSRTET